MFVITGGGTGIGRALAISLALRGQNVLIIGRREDKLRMTADVSPLITFLCADITMSVGRAEIRAHLRRVPRLSGLVHNAGVIEPIVPISALDETSFQTILSTNLEAPLLLTQQLLNQLTGGRVLHIGSGAAYFPIKGWAGYCVSKAALAMLTRCWQLESSTVSFASVKPGIIDTDMQATIRASVAMHPEKQDFFETLYATKRLIKPEAVAAFLTWLLLDVPVAVYGRDEEWDIYDTTHHPAWLVPPHEVRPLE
jgi:NAD(P)-dependent dehydrogenase (short-subunit alcohol dehydrogenase family)